MYSYYVTYDKIFMMEIPSPAYAEDQKFVSTTANNFMVANNRARGNGTAVPATDGVDARSTIPLRKLIGWITRHASRHSKQQISFTLSGTMPSEDFSRDRNVMSTARASSAKVIWRYQPATCAPHTGPDHILTWSPRSRFRSPTRCPLKHLPGKPRVGANFVASGMPATSQRCGSHVQD